MANFGKVVHCKKEYHDIYVGRNRNGEKSLWGNPFIIGKDGTREEVIAKYKDYLLSNDELMARLHELEGKILGCWCHPLPCHADILVALANKHDWGCDDIIWYETVKKRKEELNKSSIGSDDFNPDDIFQF
jgi:hypothetical protein